MNEVLGNHISTDLHDAAHRRRADQGGQSRAARGHLAARHPTYPESRPLPNRDLPTCAATPGSGSRVRKISPLRSSRGSTPRSGASTRRRRCGRSSTGWRCSTQDLDPAGVAKFVADEYAFWAPLAKEVGLDACNDAEK